MSASLNERCCSSWNALPGKLNDAIDTERTFSLEYFGLRTCTTLLLKHPT